MKALVVRVLFALGVLASGVIGQNDCQEDSDCMKNQYCYTASKLCSNYLPCSSYHRKEGTKPARSPSQCGDCILGYTAEKLVDGKDTDICQQTTSKNGNDNKVSDSSSSSFWYILLGIPCVVIICICCSHFHYYLRMKCLHNREPENEKSSPPILQNNTTIEASAPPLPLSQNNNDYSDAKENFPLSSTRECDKNIPVDFSKPVKAQSFIPPWYVNGNENYNPEDMSEAVEIARNLPEIDEDTVPSTWRPADQSTLNSVPNRPFIAINMEQEDNETNTALDNNRVCPSSSNSSEQRLPGSGHQQNGASTSEDAESNNNRRIPNQSINITVNTNFVSWSGSGKDC